MKNSGGDAPLLESPYLRKSNTSDNIKSTGLTSYEWMAQFNLYGTMCSFPYTERRLISGTICKKGFAKFCSEDFNRSPLIKSHKYSFSSELRNT